MLVRPGPAEHIGPRRRRARGSWGSSPGRGLHGCRANRSADQVALVDVTEETEVRRSWIKKRTVGVVSKVYASAFGIHFSKHFFGKTKEILAKWKK